MVHLESSDRQLLVGGFEREFRNAVRLIRAFPAAHADEAPGDCPQSGRDLAWAFVEGERRMQYVVLGRMGAIGQPPPPTLREILAAYEDVHHETRVALRRLSPELWSETIRAPDEIGVWERGRRGELLWRAWKSLVRHSAHFAAHVRAALAVADQRSVITRRTGRTRLAEQGCAPLLGFIRGSSLSGWNGFDATQLPTEGPGLNGLAH